MSFSYHLNDDTQTIWLKGGIVVPDYEPGATPHQQRTASIGNHVVPAWVAMEIAACIGDSTDLAFGPGYQQSRLDYARDLARSFAVDPASLP